MVHPPRARQYGPRVAATTRAAAAGNRTPSALKAMKFGAQLSSPCRVVDLDTDGAHLTVMLSDGTSIESRAVLIATGVHHNTLPLERWIDFEGAGIYYAATELEARACRTEPVTVVGAATSAGQAALYLASRGCQATLAVHGPDVAATMSAYLVGRLRAHPRQHRSHRPVRRVDTAAHH